MFPALVKHSAASSYFWAEANNVHFFRWFSPSVIRDAARPAVGLKPDIDCAGVRFDLVRFDPRFPVRVWFPSGSRRGLCLLLCVCCFAL